MLFTEQFMGKESPSIEKNLLYFQEVKTRIHRRLIERIDLGKLDLLKSGELVREIGLITESLIHEEGVPLNSSEKERIIVEVQHETLGLGPLEPLLADPDISDILINGSSSVYIEKHGKLEKVDVIFRNNNHLMQIIERIVSKVGRRIDESSPYVDARLADGSRVNAIIPPLAIDGPVLSIRRFGVEPLKIGDLLRLGALDERIRLVLEGVVKARLNVLISGGTGTGKTTLLNVLSEYIPGSERILTIEDSAELKLKQDHVVRLETRPPNIEGRGEVTQRDLVKNALRMRPDRIILGEVRGGEALDMLQAMNTGHDGSISTIHANTTRDAMARLDTMVLMAGMDLPERAIREQIASAINVIIQLVRFPDGTRKIVNVSEITGMEGSTIVMQDIFTFHHRGIDKDGKVVGEFKASGVRPRFAERLKIAGFELPPGIFQ
ncbi:CpaF family protein [Geobacter hydrogenophilus]|uniref:Secretion system protein TadA n=2 Tax=Geobacter hydrogenophilus TaxID=40983 RepID=A0A9W6G1T6_9BACT|nr:CpaF family protein [Geobacter hydrogenophilus]GLI38921.1 secretion system protein TadA [Geobacter hydrogenophilus]